MPAWRQTVLVLLGGLTALVLSGCARVQSPALPRVSRHTKASARTATATASTDEGEPDVEITHHASVRDGVLTVSGNTTLIPGALLDWEVGRDMTAKSGEALVYRSGSTKVAGNRYSFSTRVTRVPVSTVHVWLTFDPMDEGQPKSVTDLYGGQGEHMWGSHQNWHGDPSDIEYEFDVHK